MLDIDDELDLRDALDALTPRQREALDWRLLGYTHREIGDRLTVGRSAVSHLLFRAKCKLECHLLDNECVVEA